MIPGYHKQFVEAINNKEISNDTKIKLMTIIQNNDKFVEMTNDLISLVIELDIKNAANYLEPRGTNVKAKIFDNYGIFW